MKSLLIAAALLPSCAQTVLYRDGEKIAAFQGDMAGVEYAMAADGSVRWKAAKVNHSAATLAQGQASAGRIQAAGAAGIAILFK